MNSLVDILKKNKIKYVFSTDPYLQWQVMFYSKEEVLCRYIFEDERCPKIPPIVDKALKEGKPTAIVGYVYDLGGLENIKYIDKDKDILPIGNRYFVYFNPSKELLKKIKFEF